MIMKNPIGLDNLDILPSCENLLIQPLLRPNTRKLFPLIFVSLLALLNYILDRLRKLALEFKKFGTLQFTCSRP